MNIADAENYARIVLHEDNHLLAVCKPAGVLIQGDSSGRPNLLDLGKEYLKIKYAKPGQVFLGLVHRLDRQVGGAVVFARTSKAAARLSAQFRDHTAAKTYWAVVRGRLSPPSGQSVMHLVRDDWKSVPAPAGTPGAQRAALNYRTLKTGPSTSLVEIDLLTGRRHQIRAQLGALGCPIAGDPKYGSDLAPAGDAIGLWARRLIISHPTRNEQIVLDAPPPPDWPWLPLF